MMHWAVELPSLPGAPVQVSAESWKTALTEARKGLNLAKFRVDFEEDGTVRVHDLISNERFVLRPTSPDPSTTSLPTAAVTPSATPAVAVTPIAGGTEGPFSKTASSPAIVLPPASVPMPAGAKASARASSPTAEPTKPSAPHSPSPSVATPPNPSASPWPKPTHPLASTQLTGTPSTTAVSTPPPTGGPVVPAADLVSVSSRASSPEPTTTTPAASPSPPSQPSPPARPSQPTDQAPIVELQLPPTASLFHRRDRERSVGNDLTYRERLIAVAPGTSQEAATHLARDVWRQLVQILLPLQPGKFVSIAIFDHTFQSRPERPPITVLQWKDWRSSEPEISHPGSNASIPPGVPATVPPPAQSVSVPIATPAAPIAIISPPAPVEAPKPLSNPQMPVVRPSMVSMQTIGFGAMDAQMSAALQASPPPSAAPPATPAVPISQPSAPPSGLSQPPADPSFGQGPDISMPVPLVQIAPPVPLVQHSHQTAAPPVSAPTQLSQPAPTIRATRRTDELLGDAFEALQDLAFLREHTEACEFVAKITADLLPQTDIALSLYDIDHDELVLEICNDSTRRGTRSKIVRGHARSDATLRTTTITLASWQPDPYLPSVPEGPVLFAGISHDSRLFGVLELHRATGQRAFDLAETGAVSYVTAQLGQFLAEHSRRVGFKEEPAGTRGNRR